MDTISVSVRYGETDQMGIAYYGVYPVWFEVGRTSYLAARGLPYREVEARGVLLPVSETYYRLIAPARFEDQLDIQTWLVKRESRRVTFGYRVRRGDELLATGWTKLICLDRHFKPHRFPSWLTERLTPELGNEPA
jgi:acyl-CoA thioester hydrolase